MVELIPPLSRGSVEVSALRSLTSSFEEPAAASFWAPTEVVHERFRIVHLLGEGSNGQVYEAYDVERGSPVALRALRFGSSYGWWIERLRRDVALAQRLSHPGVCRTFELHRTDAATRGGPTFFLAMELLRGETLAARLRDGGAVEPAEALALLRGLAAGIDAAHRAGVVHGDFKTSKVVLAAAPGVPVQPVITGWGLTASSDAPWWHGSPAYLAPEVVAGEAPTPASDVYAFGLVLYEMLTGSLLFHADTRLETARNRLVQDAPPLHRLRPGLHPAWSKVASRCLERFPERRFAEGSDLVAALDRLARRCRGRFWGGVGRWLSRSG